MTSILLINYFKKWYKNTTILLIKIKPADIQPNIYTYAYL